MSKLDYYKKQYPDAVQYYEKNQSHVTEDEARIEVYKKDVPAKCLFDRSIPGSTGVAQQYIFSQQAHAECRSE